MNIFFWQSNSCYGHLRMPQTTIFGFVTLETQGGNFVTVCLYLRMVQMVWYIVCLSYSLSWGLRLVFHLAFRGAKKQW